MAIQGKKKIELTIDTVLERTSELEIISHFCPDKNWKLNDPFLSPFRAEKTPSFVIGNKTGYISYIDFGRPELRGDCFNFVKQLHNLPNLDAVLRLIDSDMKLGIADGSGVRKSPVARIERQEITKRNTLIQITTRKFTKEELAYWAQYYQDLEDLRADNVYSIQKAYLNKKQLSLDELRFGYLYDNKWWKIYQPLANKKKKWLTNVPLTYMDGLDQKFDFNKPIIIQKSKKDKMVTKKLFPDWNVVSTQNEGYGSITEENHQFFDKFCAKFIFWDNDETGIEQCKKLNSKGYGWINVPNKYKSKDISELIIEIGFEKAKEEMDKIAKNKNIC